MFTPMTCHTISRVKNSVDCQYEEDQLAFGALPHLELKVSKF